MPREHDDADAADRDVDADAADRDAGVEETDADVADESAGVEDAGEEDANGEDDDTVGFSLSLPPFSLPPLFPEDFRIVWPVGDRPRGRVSRRTVAAVLACFDAVDAVLAATTDSAALAAVRVVGGALVAATTFGTLGVVYVWEAAAVLAGFGELTAVPTLTALLVARLLR